MDINLSTILLVATPVASIAGAFGAYKMALNGTKERVKNLEAFQRDHTDRLARMETKIDILLEKI